MLPWGGGCRTGWPSNGWFCTQICRAVATVAAQYLIRAGSGVAKWRDFVPALGRAVAADWPVVAADVVRVAAFDVRVALGGTQAQPA